MSGPCVTRPVVRWHGGKWLLAPWIIGHFPTHRVYTECFGGGASVLLRKPRAYAEVYNDLDGEIVNLFRVLRGAQAGDLLDALRMTPFAREEFTTAYLPTGDEMERARRLVIRSFMGFGSNGHQKKTGFRANSNRSGTTPARDWVGYPDALALAIERLRGVTVEHRDACDVLRQHDGPAALHYLDPPYVASTRSDDKADYAHEMGDDAHRELLAFVATLKGMVIISGYPSDLYEAGLQGWLRVERSALADGARKRVEVLWLNAAAAKLLPAPSLLQSTTLEQVK